MRKFYPFFIFEIMGKKISQVWLEVTSLKSRNYFRFEWKINLPESKIV
jgi:hypothetical protein